MDIWQRGESYCRVRGKTDIWDFFPLGYLLYSINFAKEILDSKKIDSTLEYLEIHILGIFSHGENNCSIFSPFYTESENFYKSLATFWGNFITGEHFMVNGIFAIATGK